MSREGESGKMASLPKTGNIVIQDFPKIKQGRSDDGNPKILIYDCSKCKNRGMCADKTPITLDDIRRIVEYLNISWEDFFRDKVAPEPIEYRGLGMKRLTHCVFFKEGPFCSIDSVKPMHCRFTPCPIRVQSDEEYESYYLASGMIEQQFRHHVALAFTRDYVQEHGVAYDQAAVDKYLRKIDAFYEDIREFAMFCERISCYRNGEDTRTPKSGELTIDD